MTSIDYLRVVKGQVTTPNPSPNPNPNPNLIYALSLMSIYTDMTGIDYLRVLKGQVTTHICIVHICIVYDEYIH
jgi:hypothetical protein